MKTSQLIRFKFVRILLGLGAVLLACVTVPQGAHAAIVTWSTSTTGTTFSTTSNWSDNALPSAGGAKILEFGATATNGLLYNDISAAIYNGFIIDSGASAYAVSGSAFTLSGTIANNSANLLTINNNVSWSLGGSTVATVGSGNVLFNGLVTQSAGGGQGWSFNNPLTTFAGGFTSNSTTGRTLIWQGTGNILLNSLFQSATGNTGALNLNYLGSGTLALSAGTGTGAISGLNAATGVIVQVGSGVAIVAGTTGNSTLKISGNYTIGSAGAASLVVKGGNALGATGTSQGTLSLVDGGINTLTLSSTTAAATVLTMAGGAGLSSILNMEVGNNTSDIITLGSGLKASVLAGGVALNLTGIGGFTSGSATQALTLITAPGGGFTTGGVQFTLGALNSGNLGGYTTANLSASTTSALIVTLGGLTAAPGNAYWSGGLGSGSAKWNVLTGGTSNNSNWLSAATGGTDTHQSPASTTNVNFIATTGSNLTTTLGADTAINSLRFTSDASSSVTVGGANTLTINATGTNGNTSGNGITVDSSSGAHTVSSNVGLGASQTWTNNSANALAVSGTISGGANSLTKAGTGTLVLGGNNSFTGGLNINDGIVQLNNTGALNSTTPNSVTFGASAPSTARLQLNGKSVTIGALSTNATPGTPVIENANAGATATLSVSQSGATAYAGVIQDGSGSAALALTKSGAGTLTLGGANSYTGATTISNGALLVNNSLSSSVTVNATANNTSAVIGGTGTINGSVSLSGPGGSGRLNMISGGGIAATGTLTLGNGLTIATGAIAYFDGGDYLNITGGSLSIGTGVLIRVDSSLAAGTYNLIGLNGSTPTLSDFTLQYQNGGTAAGNYALLINGGILELSVTGASTAIPTLTLTSPVADVRVMKSRTITIGGAVGNVGVVALNGTLADNGGSLAAYNFSPSAPTISPGNSSSYSALVDTGTGLGTQSVSVKLTDPAASPTSTNASTTLTVLDNRVVTATSNSFGLLHRGATVSASTSLTSSGTDTNYTRVTVGNAGADANGISVSGGNTATLFDGTSSDSRTVSGTFTTAGPKTGSITLTTTGEGLTGEVPVNATVGYSASIYSGTASYTNTAGGSWATAGNWTDADVANTAGGAPGIAGALSVGDMATFSDVLGAGATTSVTLDGSSPSLAGLTLSATNTNYTLAPGSGGNISLQNAATSVAVSGTHTISAVLAGAGLSKSGSGTLVLQGANTYTGATAVTNGVLQLTAGDNRLPTTTVLTLGSGANSGQVILGDATTARNQTVAGLNSSGTGTGNSVVGANAANAVFTISNTGSNTFAGTLGGAGTNENNLALVKTGAGTQILSGSSSYTGGTTFTNGFLQASNSGALGASGTFTFNGGGLQWAASNLTDYSSRFAAIATGQSYNLNTNGQTVTLATQLAGAGGLTKSGAGTLILSQTTAYLGTTQITGGALQTLDLLPNSFIQLNGGGGVLQVVGGGSIARTLSATVANTNLTWGSNSGFSAKGGKLTVNLSSGTTFSWGANSFLPQGGVSPMVFGSPTADSQVEFQNPFTLGAGVSPGFNRVIFVDSGTGGDSALLSGAISTSGTDSANVGFVKDGNGTLILSGSNTYAGATIIRAGTLVAGTDSSGTAGVAGAFGDAHTTTVITTGTTVTAGTLPVTMGDATTTSANTSPSLLIGGAFNVGRPITISNQATTGKYTLGGNTDGNAIFSGTITTSQPFTVTQVATTGNNALNITGGVTGLTTGTKAVTFANVGAVNVSGAIADGTGKISVTQSGAGITTLSAANTYTGPTTINAGELKVDGSLAAGSAVTVNAGTLRGQGTVNGTVNLTGTSTLRSSSTLTLNSSLTVSGTANQITTGVIAVNGVTTINSGAVLSAGINGTLAGAGSVIDNGTFIVNGFANQGIAVNNGGILAGTGTTGNVVLSSGGTVAPGNDSLSTGILNVGYLNMASGAHLSIKIGGSVAGTGYDQVATAGALALNGDLQGSLINGYASSIVAGTSGAGYLDGSTFYLTLGASFTTGALTNVGAPTGNALAAGGQGEIFIGGVDFAVFYNATGGSSLTGGNDLALLAVAVPEPGTWVMLLAGFGMLISFQRLRGRRQVGT